MKRTGLIFLKEWLSSTDRKPLVIRGARQVGKTWLVRHLAESENLNLIELNLEKRPSLASLFSTNDPRQIILNLEAAFNRTINPQKSLLFLDEIQAVPELLAKLRWFAEDMRELPVIAAGSLLEFVLSKHAISMPVGRINYMHLEPLSFEEFLLANDKSRLVEYIKLYTVGNEIAREIHEQLMGLFKEYIIVGGMPQAVSSWVNKRSLQAVSQVHHDLIATYRDDFAKYSGRMSTERLEDVLMAVPKHLGKKFVYSRVNPSIQIDAIKRSLDLLSKARVCHKVLGSAANGVPLAAEVQEKYLKVILLDVGLCSAILGLSLDQINLITELDLINKGGIAEQVVGQLLRTIAPPYVEPALYYWHREEKGSSAEIDYVIQYRNIVIPIEVKAGSTGSLKSLHYFMGLKQFPLAVRINSDIPQKIEVSVKDNQGNPVKYLFLSIPFYLLGELHRLLSASLYLVKSSRS